MNKSTLLLLVLVCLFQTGCSLAPYAANRAYKEYDANDYKESLRLATRALIKYDYSREETANLLFLKGGSYLKLKNPTYASGIFDYIINEYPHTEAAYKARTLLESDNVLNRLDGVSYHELYGKSNAQVLTKVGMKYIATLTSANHDLSWKSSASECAEMEKDSVVEFKAVIEIMQDGNVSNITATKSGLFVECFIAKIKNTTYPSPPFNHYYLPVSIDLNKEG
jgi:tetratricopeptide (TPR) repeat protein